MSGQYKVNYHLWQNIINGVTAGAYISLGGFFACIVGGGLTEMNTTNPGLARLIMALVFPFGLLMVVLTGGELITSSFSTVGAAFVAGIFKGKQRRAIFNMCIIYWTNFLGCLFVAGIALGTGAFEKDPYRTWLLHFSEKKVHQSWGQAFWRGVLANWMVSMATMLTFAAKDVVGKAAAMWPLITAFVAMGMDHCVANMFFLVLGIFLGAEFSWAQIFTGNLIPVTLGNFVGSQLCSLVYSVRYQQTAFFKKDSIDRRKKGDDIELATAAQALEEGDSDKACLLRP